MVWSGHWEPEPRSGQGLESDASTGALWALGCTDSAVCHQKIGTRWQKDRHVLLDFSGPSPCLPLRSSFSLIGWSEVKWSGSVVSTLCDPMDCSPPGSSIHGIFQATVLEWVAISFSRGSSRPRYQTQVSHIVGRHFTLWATREVAAYRLGFHHGQVDLDPCGCSWAELTSRTPPTLSLDPCPRMGGAAAGKVQDWMFLHFSMTESHRLRLPQATESLTSSRHGALTSP